MHPIDEEIARWQARRRCREQTVLTMERLAELSYVELQDLAQKRRVNAAANRQKIIVALYRQEYELDKRVKL